MARGINGAHAGLCLMLIGGLWACGSDDDGSGDATGGSTGGAAGGSTGGAQIDAGPGGSAGGSGGSAGGAGGSGGSAGGSGGSGGEGGSGGAGYIDEYGFELRVPQRGLEVPCAEGDECFDSTTADQVDHVCTVVYGDFVGALYVRADPMAVTSWGTPLYEPAGAWLSVDGLVSPVTASYDWGGNHHNDEIVADLDGTTWRLYHSSFEIGWRACHPMDCLQRIDASGAVVEDGCTWERTLPIVCLPIDDEGMHGPLSDTFEPCPTDPDRPE
ncbi:hypothetical protein L6V77_23890 [Myxococcota bacterium]|nr:hypothetical protein [Myxococcota bacterium]